MTRPACLLLLLAGPAAAADRKLEYNRDVRPILAENCFACHGPDSAARKAGLRLDQRDAAIEKEAIVPGKPGESVLVERLFLADDDKKRMPPKNSHKELKPAQKETLKQWIAQGAVYEPHWSLIPPTKPAVPTVADKSWVRNPIDAFVLAEMTKRGLKPAPEADRRTLARRLALDLTGLPPTPAQVDGFVADKSADYYEKYVAALMASPAWGEHRGRYWLDAARYADTHGIHFDNYREMWAYRDWVINAFNANQKFDQFTLEQLAGDLLPNPTLDQRVATGFNRCNITTNEGGAINEEYLVLYNRDRTETVAQTWLGLTAGCAVCHDHKFDPLGQKEFYALAAFFNNTTQSAMDGNIKDTPPTVFVPAKADRAAWERLDARRAENAAKRDARRKEAKPAFDTWLTTATPAVAAAPTSGLVLHAPFDEGAGTVARYAHRGAVEKLTLPAGVEWKPGPGADKAANVKPAAGSAIVFPPEVADFEADAGFSVGAWVQIPNRGQYAAILSKMDEKAAHRGFDVWLDNDKFATHVVGSWPADAFKVTTRTTFNPNNWYHVFVTYDGSRTPAGVRIYVNGEPQPTDTIVNNRQTGMGDTTLSPAGSIKTAAPLTVGRRTPGAAVRQMNVQDVRAYGRTLSGPEVAKVAAAGKVVGLIAKAADKRTPKETDELYSWWLDTQDAVSRETAAEAATIKQDETAFRARGTIAHVSNEKPTSPEAYVLYRGEYDQRRDKVGPGTPKVLPAFPADLPKNRLGFAKWLLAKDNPLTGRVTVNRFWQEVFGQGLVRTAGDFGVTGELPSHPELLDWLAEEFESHWDVKRFFTLIVTSATYRQSAAATKEKVAADPSNVWLARGPRFRMDAEMIRDYALAVSGLLVPKIGGPSVRPYQPEGVWEAVAMPESNTRFYKPDGGDSLYRRSLYTFWKRAAPPAGMEVLNAPNREQCTVKRERTNTPLQALLTLNDVQYVEAARVLAERVIAAHKTDDARIDALSMTLLARPFRAAEKAVVTESLAELRKEFAAKPAEAKKLLAFGEKKPADGLDAGEVAAWAMLCNQLLNLDEVLNK